MGNADRRSVGENVESFPGFLKLLGGNYVKLRAAEGSCWVMLGYAFVISDYGHTREYPCR